jgi:endonuclease
MRKRFAIDDRGYGMTKPGFRMEEAYAFAAAKGYAEEVSRIRALAIHPELRVAASRVRKGHLVELLESKGLMRDFAAAHWPAYGQPSADRRRAAFLQAKRRNERLFADGLPVLPEVDPIGEPEDQDEDVADAASFALESQLRDFIADNLPRLAVGGARLKLFRDSANRSGIEYPTAVGPIDILAVDASGRFYVFELKLERGPDRAMGQLMRYMGWVSLNLAGSQTVLGVIVASSIDAKLRYAAAVNPNVRLLEYEVEFRLKDVEPMAGTSQPLS